MLACAVVAGTALFGLSVTTASAAAAPNTAGQSSDTVITLATGDRIAVTTAAGKTSYSPLGNATAGFHEFQAPGGDEYLIPASAQPFLGRGLDESLFDVTALVRNGDAARIPVNLSFAPGSTPAAPAGVTLTSVTGQTAAGYLTPDSAAAFGAALKHSIGADVAAGRAAGSTAAFPGLTALSLAGATAPSSVTPNYPLHIVQVNVTDLTGAPANDDLVYLADTDNYSRLLSGMPIVNGIGKVEAPAGNYMLVAYFNDFDTSGNLTAQRQVIQDGLTVPATTGTTTFAVSESEANLEVTVTAPRPTSLNATIDLYARTDATGQVATFGTIGNGAPLYVNATTPTVGSAYMALYWFALAADKSYLYSVAFGDKTGIPANETFVVRPDQLATLTNRLYSTPGTTGNGTVISTPVDPVIGATWGYGPGANWGQNQTQYVGTADGGAWQFLAFSPQPALIDAGPAINFTAGRKYGIEWNKEPAVPSLVSRPAGYFCVACVGGSTLNLYDEVLGDSDPGHQISELNLPKSEELAFYQGGTKVYDSAAPAVDVLNIPAAHTVYREVLDQDWSGLNGFALGTTTHTERTFSYDPNDPAIDTQYGCDGWTATTSCQVLPVLNAHYDLAGLDLTDTSTDRIQRLELDISHLTYGGVGSHSPIRSVTLSVSFDGGKHWVPVPVIGRDGHYLAFWPNFAAGATPDLQVTAKDAAGNALSQTVTNAYTIGATK